MSITTATELWRMSATELAEAIRSRQVSSQEVIEAHLQHIEAVNGSINAVVIVMAEQALNAAKTADRTVADGADLGPFHGVPFTVKENIDVAGTPTTQGFKALTNAYPSRDAPIVERLKAAGAIPIGRTNLPSGAIRWHCESELWGATVNPWDRSRTPRASSAGEAAAIATGMSPLGLGNDGLGSLRHPAQCCGVSALKSTLGRIPSQRSAGAAGRGPPRGVRCHGRANLAGPVDGARAASRARSSQTRPSRCGARPCRPGNRRAGADGVRRAAHALEQAGYAVEELEPPGIDAAAKGLVIMYATPGIRAVWQQVMPPSLPAATRRFMSAFFEAAGDPDALGAEQAFMTRLALLRSWSEFQEDHPLIVAPIATDIPRKAGTDLDEGQVAEDLRIMRMAMAVNALGLPAVGLPVGIRDGLPQAVQLIGPRYREDICLDTARALEDQVGIITPIDPR